MASTQRRTSGAVYEEFQPNIELKETPEAHILYIHLPGFTGEQVKITYVASTKAINISGEKPIGSKKWIHFDEAIPVPANCEVNRLHGKFDKEILTITMPKKFITPVVPKEELRSSEEEISQDPSLGPTYEEFHPKVEKIENSDAYLLQIYLPGFIREEVKIRYLASTQALIISGEKLEGGNKWSRLNEAIPVPENCEVSRIHGRFDQEILTITMPKKIITPVVPKEELRKSEEEISQAPSLGAAYEEFQPKVEKIENLDAYFLQVYLPGFSIDQVNINNDRSSRVISIYGERPIEGGKRWSRFAQAFPVPENSNEERLVVKFEQEVLTIKIPKRVTSLVAPIEVAVVEPKPHRAEKVIPSKPISVEGLKRSSPHLSLQDEKASTGTVYEEFQPISEILESLKAYNLRIHLPGFTRDQVKFRYVNSTKTLSISGEKPVGGNKWSRFREVFSVPENCEVDRLGDKFDQGILSISIPKKIITPVVPKEQKISTQEISQDPSHEDEKSQNQSIMKESIPTYSGKVLRAPRKQTEEKTVVADATKERDTRKEVEESYEEPSESYEEPSESRNPKKGLSEVKEKESKEDNQYLAKAGGSSPPRISMREKETIGKAPAGDGGKCKENIIEAARKGIKDVSTAASVALKGIREGTLKDEEKNLLLNMGATAVAVVAALGVYVSYKFVSSGKS